MLFGVQTVRALEFTPATRAYHRAPAVNQSVRMRKSTYKSHLHCKDATLTSYPEHLFTEHFINIPLNAIVGWLENKEHIKNCLNVLIELADI